MCRDIAALITVFGLMHLAETEQQAHKTARLVNLAPDVEATAATA